MISGFDEVSKNNPGILKKRENFLTITFLKLVAYTVKMLFSVSYLEKFDPKFISSQG